MRTLSLTILIPLLAISVSQGQQKPAETVHGSPSQSSPSGTVEAPARLSLTFYPSSSGTPMRSLAPGLAALDLGHVSYIHGARMPGVQSQRSTQSLALSSGFGLRLDTDRKSALMRATLSAFVNSVSPYYTVTIDGVTLSTEPTAIHGAVLLGVAIEHKLEIRVSKLAPEGPVTFSIGFLATAN